MHRCRRWNEWQIPILQNESSGQAERKGKETTSELSDNTDPTSFRTSSHRDKQEGESIPNCNSQQRETGFVRRDREFHLVTVTQRSAAISYQKTLSTQKEPVRFWLFVLNFGSKRIENLFLLLVCFFTYNSAFVVKRLLKFMLLRNDKVEVSLNSAGRVRHLAEKFNKHAKKGTLFGDMSNFSKDGAWQLERVGVSGWRSPVLPAPAVTSYCTKPQSHCCQCPHVSAAI